MCRGIWDIGSFWGYPYFFSWGGMADILFQLAVLGLIIWAVASIVKNLACSKQQNIIKDGGVR